MSDVAGDTTQALSLLREVAEGLAASGTDEEKGVLQLLLGDATYQVGASLHWWTPVAVQQRRSTLTAWLHSDRCHMWHIIPCIHP